MSTEKSLNGWDISPNQQECDLINTALEPSCNLSFDEIGKWVDLIERVKKINDEFLGLAIQVNQDTFKAVAPIDITAIINEFNLVLKGVKSE
jgi:hypothetical protein